MNDGFRLPDRRRVLFKAGIIAKGPEFQEELIQAVRTISDFYENCDPWREHDLGAIIIEGSRIISKLDYFDCFISMRPEDPADAKTTKRAMNVLLLAEYYHSAQHQLYILFNGSMFRVSDNASGTVKESRILCQSPRWNRILTLSNK